MGTPGTSHRLPNAELLKVQRKGVPPVTGLICWAWAVKPLGGSGVTLSSWAPGDIEPTLFFRNVMLFF